jgi:redox-sensitive bicupin YhaK (pirin superfamily)
MGELEKGITQNYDVKKVGDGLYIFVIDGVVSIDGHKLNKRDAITVSDAEKVTVTLEENSKVLIIEVPMAW